jgi:cysteine desulfurase
MRIYVDHNATAPLHPAAAAVWQTRAQLALPANPSSIHWAGRGARRDLSEARERIAALLGVGPRELFFTASGTEANATTLRGAVRLASGARRRVLVNPTEHPSVLGTLEALAQGRPDLVIERIALDHRGVVDLRAFEAQLDPSVLLVSLMFANNETGIVQPVEEVALLARARGALVHCDAAQAVGKRRVDLAALGVDLATAGGHKFGAGLGAGLLVVRRGISLEPLLSGHQEGGLRGGTENVAAVVAAAAALDARLQEIDLQTERLSGLRGSLERGLLGSIPGARLHGADAPRLANTSLLTFPGAEGEAVLIGLDVEGIAASSGAACASGSIEPSHVLLAMGVPILEAATAVRFSLGPSNTEAEIEHLLEVVPRVVAAVRRANEKSAEALVERSP